MKPLQLTASEKKILDEVFSSFPQFDFFIFGSRTLGKARPLSDLDVCIKSAEPISDVDVALLKEQLENSSLPFVVDIVRYDRVAPDFRLIIDRDGVPWR